MLTTALPALVLTSRSFAQRAAGSRPISTSPPSVTDIRALEFYRAEEIYAQAAQARQTLERQLREAVAAYAAR